MVLCTAQTRIERKRCFNMNLNYIQQQLDEEDLFYSTIPFLKNKLSSLQDIQYYDNYQFIIDNIEQYIRVATSEDILKYSQLYPDIFDLSNLQPTETNYVGTDGSNCHTPPVKILFCYPSDDAYLKLHQVQDYNNSCSIFCSISGTSFIITGPLQFEIFHLLIVDQLGSRISGRA